MSCPKRGKATGGWAIAQSPIMGTTVTEARLAQRGYQSFTNYYEQLFHGS
jgi:RNA-directed DNA polymerase